MNGNDATMILIGMGLSFIVFLIFREVVCWYFKMNEVTKLLREIRESLKGNPPNKRHSD